MKHFTIPVFVPELACPNRCVFCNQHSISGCQHQPDTPEVRSIIQKHLTTLPRINAHIEIGFFGGSFTGIDSSTQEEYLAVANEFTVNEASSETPSGILNHQRRVNSIRISTRPDYINEQVLERLKRFGVTTIELGAQSLDDKVLQRSGRGHTVADVELATTMILSAGFRLGLQMMTGLPGDTAEKAKATARKIVALGAHCTRIYPTLVIRDTDLEKEWKNGSYYPQSLDEAVELTAELLDIFETHGVEVIRTGLHPSEGILDGSEMLAGPFHPSFRELVETYRWKKKLEKEAATKAGESEFSIIVSEKDLRYAIGYNASNRRWLEKDFEKIQFVTLESADNKTLFITDRKLPLPVKNKLKSIGKLCHINDNSLVYKSITGHPDIFMCYAAEGVVVAPAMADSIGKMLEGRNIPLYTGRQNPGKKYPDSARYNAVVTDQFIIHNLKITDPVISLAFPGRRLLHVNQGYTRCNLLPLGTKHFITSDKGIFKTLVENQLEVLLVNPESIRLKGQKYGFIGGCLGLHNGTLYLCGSLNYHPQRHEIETFIEAAGLSLCELYDGPLYDGGGVFVF